ncbi:hypothetical protein J3F83DRAFT_57781 [Trichoderma novae-zelandiae]
MERAPPKGWGKRRWRHGGRMGTGWIPVAASRDVQRLGIGPGRRRDEEQPKDLSLPLLTLAPSVWSCQLAGCICLLLLLLSFLLLLPSLHQDTEYASVCSFGRTKQVPDAVRIQMQKQKKGFSASPKQEQWNPNPQPGKKHVGTKPAGPARDQKNNRQRKKSKKSKKKKKSHGTGTSDIYLNTKFATSISTLPIPAVSRY